MNNIESISMAELRAMDHAGKLPVGLVERERLRRRQEQSDIHENEYLMGLRHPNRDEIPRSEYVKGCWN